MKVFLLLVCLLSIAAASPPWWIRWNFVDETIALEGEYEETKCSQKFKKAKDIERCECYVIQESHLKCKKKGYSWDTFPPTRAPVTRRPTFFPTPYPTRQPTRKPSLRPTVSPTVWECRNFTEAIEDVRECKGKRRCIANALRAIKLP